MSRFEGKKPKLYDNSTLDYRESNRVYANRLDGNFNIFEEIKNDLKSNIDSGCAMFLCRSWDYDKQEGVFQALFIYENENQPRVFDEVPNGTNIKYDLQGGEVCLLAPVFGDLDSQMALEPVYCPVWQGIGGFVLISVLSDCFFEVQHKGVSFAFTKDGLTIKGGGLKVEGKISTDSDIEAQGDIKSDGDVSSSQVKSLNEHKHIAGTSLFDGEGKPVIGSTGTPT